MQIGIDVGRGYTKALSSHSQGVVKFPSYVAEGRRLDLGNLNNTDPVNRLRVEIGGNSWFIGELARREGGTREFQKEKYRHRNTLPLILTAIALSTEDSLTAPKAVIGLPISDYREQSKRFLDSISGDYKISLPHKKAHIELSKQNMLTFPEGAGAAWDLLLNNAGKPINSQLAHGTIAILDIGWKTCNFTVLKQYESRN